MWTTQSVSSLHVPHHSTAVGGQLDFHATLGPNNRETLHYQTLTHVNVSLPMQRLANTKAHTSRFISANLPCNKFKNRLVNIMPYESTRVCLQPIRGVEGSDYINASFIDGYR